MLQASGTTLINQVCLAYMCMLVKWLGLNLSLNPIVGCENLFNPNVLICEFSEGFIQSIQTFLNWFMGFSFQTSDFNPWIKNLFSYIYIYVCVFHVVRGGTPEQKTYICYVCKELSDLSSSESIEPKLLLRILHELFLV